MKESEIKKLKEVIEKVYSQAGRDVKTFDIEAELDNKLSYAENKEIILDKIYTILGIPNSELKKKYKNEYAGMLQQHLNEFEREADEQFKKSLEAIENEKSSDIINEIYYSPKQFAKMVVKGYARGFLLYGEAGIGKSHSVLKVYADASKPFRILKGHVTSLEFYNFLFEHRAEHIILDDVNILENEQNLNLLKACLSDKDRTVEYHSTSNKLTAPNRFVFDGSIIIILNKIPKNDESLEAVKSRVLNYEMKLDYRTKIKVLFELAKQDYKELDLPDRLKIARWLKDNTSPATENLNLRLLFQLFEVFRFDKDNWEKLGKKLIIEDRDLSLIVKGLSQQEWSEETGLSRRTYFRKKKEIEIDVWECHSDTKKVYEVKNGV